MTFFLIKVERSIALLKSLDDEKQRWESSSETFKSQMSTIVGDVLLSSAFMAYAGKYIHYHMAYAGKYIHYYIFLFDLYGSCRFIHIDFVYFCLF